VGIVYGTARLNLHPFLALLAAAYGFGMLAGLPLQETVAATVEGFGRTLGYIGVVIAAGAIIGAALERSGGALAVAQSLLRRVGEARSTLALGLTGALVSIPVFCDSGFIILAPLARSLAAKARQSLAAFAVVLSMGLYTTHVFVPPTPGPIAAAGELGAPLGLVIVLGVACSVPVLIATYAFARFMGRRIYVDPGVEADVPEGPEPQGAASPMPMPWRAVLPITVPVGLIALRSIAELPAGPLGEGAVAEALAFVGHPNTALLLGVLVVYLTMRNRLAEGFSDLVAAALRQAGPILLITGAGGAFGRVLQTTALGPTLEEALGGLDLGALSIVLPFVLAAALKTALGSSTVAIITTASIMTPLLVPLGLADAMGPVLVTLAVGAGSMTVSHANDSYFWVVSQFSGMSVSEAYRLQTGGSAVAGATGLAAVLVLSLLL
ncbi:MAG: GntP family permease, partial [Rhodothermales bacterium]|nr:GntP family permease [Rhodothermales bacterium]